MMLKRDFVDRELRHLLNLFDEKEMEYNDSFLACWRKDKVKNDLIALKKQIDSWQSYRHEVQEEMLEVLKQLQKMQEDSQQRAIETENRRQRELEAVLKQAEIDADAILKQDQLEIKAQLQVMDNIIWDVRNLFVTTPHNNGYDRFLEGYTMLFEEVSDQDMRISYAHKVFDEMKSSKIAVKFQFTVSEFDGVMICGSGYCDYIAPSPDLEFDLLDNSFNSEGLYMANLLGKVKMLEFEQFVLDVGFVDMPKHKLLSKNKVILLLLGVNGHLLAYQCNVSIKFPTGIGTSHQVDLNYGLKEYIAKNGVGFIENWVLSFDDFFFIQYSDWDGKINLWTVYFAEARVHLSSGILCFECLCSSVVNFLLTKPKDYGTMMALFGCLINRAPGHGFPCIVAEGNDTVVMLNKKKMTMKQNPARKSDIKGTSREKLATLLKCAATEWPWDSLETVEKVMGVKQIEVSNMVVDFLYFIDRENCEKPDQIVSGKKNMGVHILGIMVSFSLDINQVDIRYYTYKNKFWEFNLHFDTFANNSYVDYLMALMMNGGDLELAIFFECVSMFIWLDNFENYVGHKFSSRVIDERPRLELLIGSHIIMNLAFVASDSLILEGLQFMLEGKFRHLPHIESIELLVLLDVTECLYVVLYRMGKGTQGNAIVTAMEGDSHLFKNNFSGLHNFIETLVEYMVNPPLSTQMGEHDIQVLLPSEPVYGVAKKMEVLQGSMAVYTLHTYIDAAETKIT